MNKKRKYISIFVLIFILAVLVVATTIVVIQFIHKIDLREQNYYAYGDSITHGSGTNMNYMTLFDMLFNIEGNVSCNADGSAKTTQWGLDNFIAHCGNKQNYIVIEAFGFVDEYFDIEPQVTAQNKLAMYNLSKTLGIKTYFVGIPVRTNYPTETEYEYILAIETMCKRFNIPYITLYDAVDTIPFNEHFDSYNSTNFVDGVHPNEKGQFLLSVYLWNWLCTYYNTGQQYNDFNYTLVQNYTG